MFSNVWLKIQAMAETVTGLKDYIERLQQQIQDARCQKAWKSVFGGNVFQQWLKPMVVSKHACAVWNNMAHACALFQIAHACFEKTIDFNHSWNTLPPKTNVQALWQMYQETSEQNVRIYWQQQAGVERIKTGFDHAERSAETMNSHLVNLHIKMDHQIWMLENQMRRLQDIQKHLAAEYQNITGSNIIRTLGGGISSIQRPDHTSMTNQE